MDSVPSSNSSQADALDDESSVASAATGSGSLSSSTVASTVVSASSSEIRSLGSNDSALAATQYGTSHGSNYQPYYHFEEFSPKAGKAASGFVRLEDHASDPSQGQARQSIGVGIAPSSTPVSQQTTAHAHEAKQEHYYTNRPQPQPQQVPTPAKAQAATPSSGLPTRNHSSSIIIVPIKRGRGRPKRAVAELQQQTSPAKFGSGDSDGEDAYIDESVLNGTSLPLNLPESMCDAASPHYIDVQNNALPWDNDEEMMRLILPSMLPQLPPGVSLLYDTTSQTIVAASRRRGRPSRAMIEEQQYLLQKLILDHLKQLRRRCLGGGAASGTNGTNGASTVRPATHHTSVHQQSRMGTQLVASNRNNNVDHAEDNSSWNGAQSRRNILTLGSSNHHQVDLAATGSTNVSHTMGATTSLHNAAELQLESYQDFYSRIDRNHPQQHRVGSHPYYDHRQQSSDSDQEDAEASRSTLEGEASVSDAEFDIPLNMGLHVQLPNVLHGNSLLRPKSGSAESAVLPPPKMQRMESMDLSSRPTSSSSESDISIDDELCFFEDSSPATSTNNSHSSSPVVTSQSDLQHPGRLLGSNSSVGMAFSKSQEEVGKGSELDARRPNRMGLGSRRHTGSRALSGYIPSRVDLGDSPAGGATSTLPGYKLQYALPSAISDSSDEEEEEDELGSQPGVDDDGSRGSAVKKTKRTSSVHTKFPGKLSKKDRNKLSAMKYRQKRKLFMKQLEMKTGMMEHVLVCLLEEADSLSSQVVKLGGTPTQPPLGSMSSRILQLARENECDILDYLHRVDHDGYPGTAPLPQFFVADVSCQALQEAETQFVSNQLKNQQQGLPVPTGPLSVLASHVIPRAGGSSTATSSGSANLSTVPTSKSTQLPPPPQYGFSLTADGTGFGLNGSAPAPQSQISSTLHPQHHPSHHFGPYHDLPELKSDLPDHLDAQNTLGLGVKRQRLSVVSQGIVMFALFAFFFMVTPFSQTSHADYAIPSLNSFLPSDMNAYFVEPTGGLLKDVSSAWSAIWSIAESFNPYPRLPDSTSRAHYDGPSSEASSTGDQLSEYLKQVEMNKAMAGSKRTENGPRSRVLLTYDQQQQQQQPPYHQHQQPQPQAQPAQYQQAHPQLPHAPDTDQDPNATPQAVFSMLLKSAQTSTGNSADGFPGGSTYHSPGSATHAMDGASKTTAQLMQRSVSILDLMALFWHILMPILFYFLLTRCGVLDTLNMNFASRPAPGKTEGVRATVIHSESEADPTKFNNVAAAAAAAAVAAAANTTAVDVATQTLLLRQQQEQQQRKQALAEQMIAIQRDERLLQQQAQYLYQRQQQLQQFKIYQQQLQQQQLQEQEQLRRHEKEQLTVSGVRSM